MANPLARLVPCQSSGLPPEVTFLCKAFYPPRLKNFTLGPPLQAIFFSCVMNSPQRVITFSGFCLLCFVNGDGYVWGSARVLCSAPLEMNGSSEQTCAFTGGWLGMKAWMSCEDNAHWNVTRAGRALCHEGRPKFQCVPVLGSVQNLPCQACQPCSLSRGLLQ